MTDIVFSITFHWC